MRISQIHIENYRSIKSLEFYPGNYCALIGENNAGKTNILKAINLVLGDSWPSERTFTEDDYNEHNTINDIVIQLYFDEIIEEWRNNCKCEVAGLELRGKAYKRRVGTKPAGTLTVDYVCITRSGKPCQYPDTPFEDGKKFSGRMLPLKVTSTVREKAPFIYVDVMRDYNKQDPSNRWSILRRLFSSINTGLSSEKPNIPFDTPDEHIMITRKQAFERKISEAYNYLRTPDFVEIESRIRNNALEQMGIDAAEGDISIRFDTYDPMNVYKNLQLIVEQSGISTTADMVGAGLQSAIVMSIFRTYEEIAKEGAIFAVEEPEVYLHPQKQRYFSNTLSRLADRNQVFITTHSPVFVKLYEPESICLIRRDRSSGSTTKMCEKDKIIATEKDALKIQNYFDNQRNEMFFAKGVILVEGATEKFVFPYAARKLGIDLDRLGISTVECGGKGNLLTFARVADAFRIPYIVVADNDIVDTTEIIDMKRRERAESQNTSNLDKNNAITGFVPANQLFWMNPNIEGVMGISESTDNKIMQALNHMRKITRRADFEEAIVNPIRAIISLTGAIYKEVWVVDEGE